MEVGDLVYDKVLGELCIIIEVRPAMVVLLSSGDGGVYPVQTFRLDDLEVINGRKS